MNSYVSLIKLCNNITRSSSDIIVSKFSTSQTCFKIVPKNLKKFSKSSQDWLTRHLNDPYVKLSKQHHYRARSAFKLIEIDERYKILYPGQIIVECGAAPGAWTQVIVEKINSKDENASIPVGKVIAIDLVSIYSVEGAVMMGLHDFTLEKTQKLVEEELNGAKVDLVLSDMSPRVTGTKAIDHPLIMDLAFSAFKFAKKNSKNGSHFLCKIFAGYKLDEFVKDVRKCYETVKIVKPTASRSESPETFILARNFRNLNNVIMESDGKKQEWKGAT